MVGVNLQPGDISAADARGLNLPDTRGALVTDVPTNSPAGRAGVQRGDVIRSVDGRAISQSSELPPIIGAMAPGSKVRLGVMRDGREREVVVTLAPLQQGAAAGELRFDEARNAQRGAAGPSNPLGIVGQDLDADDRRQLGLRNDEGVGVARVQGLAAREAGVRPGDVILAVGRTNVASVAAMDRELAKAKPDETIMLLVRRGGGTQYVAVTARPQATDR